MPAELGIFGIDWFTKVILPFILVFVLIFAILERSKILGEEKTQINSIVSLVMALIMIGVPLARGIIVDIVPVVAVIAVVLLVFMLILGMVGATHEGKLNKPLQITTGIIIGIAIIITLLYSTGWLPKIKTITEQPWASQLWQSLIFIAVIITVIVIAVRSAKEKGPTSG